MAKRTTVILDEEALRAARQLARRYGCSVSATIRRSLLAQRDAALGLTARRRRLRTGALDRLFEMFDGVDPASEVRRLKSEERGF